MDKIPEDLREMMERVNANTENLRVIKETLATIQKAVNYYELGENEEFWETVDELYLESNRSVSDNVLTFLELLMLHMFKLAYGNNKNSSDYLMKEIRNFRKEIIWRTAWDLKKRRKNIISMVVEQLDVAYSRAVKEFQWILSTSQNDYSISTTKSFASECPWSLQELMDCDVEDLIWRIQ